MYVRFLSVWWMNWLYGRSIQSFGCDHYSIVYILHTDLLLLLCREIDSLNCLLSVSEQLLAILTLHVFIFQLALPSESATGTCFLQYYIESILALQDASCRFVHG